MQNCHDRLNICQEHFLYKTMAQFQFQTNLEQINVFEYMQAFSKLRISSNRLAI